MIVQQIKKDLTKVLKKLSISAEKLSLEHPGQPDNGDYSTNIAMRIKKKAYPTPWDLANAIVNAWRSLGLPEYIAKIEVAKPGFINIWLKNETLINKMGRVLKEKDKYGFVFGKDKKPIMVEYAQPNILKQFHLGHLRNICLGESISRFLEASGHKIVRANYQGDVGMHVAKCLWQIQQTRKALPKSLGERIKYLAKAYIKGNQAYTEKPDAKKEVEALNHKIYAQDPEIKELWQQTRGWSLEYFDRIYQRLGVKFNRLYFEGEVADPGKKIVLQFLKKKVFARSEGAIIFPGEKYGLHNRVFVNQQGLPTYEAKDMALAKLQFKEFNPRQIIHVVGSEQKGYFGVIFKALKQINPKTANKEFHLVYGWVRLKAGKMASRIGQVVLAEWLLDEVKKRLTKAYKMNQKVAEEVTVGAVKYSLLKFNPSSEMVFDIDESINLEGDSGPYLQYTYARCQSVLKKAEKEAKGELAIKMELNEEEAALLRTIYKFPEVVIEAGDNYAPNLMTNFLFDLAQKYNLFYNRHRIIQAESEQLVDFRLALTAVVAQVIKNGLYLLGIEAPERM
ncbi:MAG TPA: arginine--tRNA ligase [Nevskiaceae bacterium]|nr:arginine--tRNA ligase [Nevskiaceae bacterium]